MHFIPNFGELTIPRPKLSRMEDNIPASRVAQPKRLLKFEQYDGNFDNT